MIQNGSIEVVTGEMSEGFVFGPDTDYGPFDNVTNIDAEVLRISDAIINSEEPNAYAANGCQGVWNGIDRNGESCKISVWSLQP